MGLSVAIAAKNESKNIEKCIRAIDFADEIIVVDDCSDDNTAEIALSLGAVVETVDSYGSFHKNKNRAIELAKCEWILSLDADEVVSSQLTQSIQLVLKAPKVDGYLVDRHNYFVGKWIRGCGWYPNHLLRLFKKGMAWWPLEIHDVPRLKGGNGILTVLEGPLIHYSYNSFEQYFEKFNQYTSRLAVEYAENEVRMGGMRQGVNLVARPMYWFMKKYIFLRGYRDGRLGLFISLSSALTIFVSYLKLLEMSGKSDNG